jgi:RNA polymerase-binding transcription factor DksA
MEATTIDTSFNRLTKRREQLLTTLRHLDDEQNQVERNTDWVDEAAYDSRVALLDGLRYDYQAEMARIDRALERIAHHEFGACTACHEPVDPKRLESVPEAEHCFACESFREEVEQFAA